MATRPAAARLIGRSEEDRPSGRDQSARSRHWEKSRTDLEIQRLGRLRWFAEQAAETELGARGFRLAIGGAHLARTLMLAELDRLLAAVPDSGLQNLNALVIDENLLNKRTASGRRLSLRHLRELYGLDASTPISSAMVALWASAGDGQPVLALLAALSREPLLRDSAELILPEASGALVTGAELAAFFERRYPGRYTLKMLGSLSRNCASSWTQSGHLKGTIRKERARPAVTPVVAAYAVLLGALAGFGGPALLASPWIMVLDRSQSEVLSLLRIAEAKGMLRLRVGGDVVEIEVRRHMAAALEIPELADNR
jgi:hypothetical protein